MQTFRLTILCLALWLAGTDCCAASAKSQSPSVTVKGQDLIKPDGGKLFNVGSNLGNWLCPEGYRFNFQRTNSEWMFNAMLCELIGPDETRTFWQAFKDMYITQNNIAFIKKTGLPMYMGEIGHNSDEWQARFCQVMREANIGYRL